MKSTPKKPENEQGHSVVSRIAERISRPFRKPGKELEALHQADTSRFGQFIEKIRGSPTGKSEKAWFLLFKGSPLCDMHMETVLLNQFVLEAYGKKLKLENTELSARSALAKFEEPHSIRFSSMSWNEFLAFMYQNAHKSFKIHDYLQITGDGKLRPTPALAGFMRTRLQNHLHEVPV